MPTSKHTLGKALLYIGLSLASLFSLLLIAFTIFFGKYVITAVAVLLTFTFWKYPRYSRWILGPFSALTVAGTLMRAYALFGTPDWGRFIYFCIFALLAMFCTYVFLISYPVKRYLDSTKTI